jgi:hypothetical protein
VKNKSLPSPEYLRIYVAGRMSGVEDNNRPWFEYMLKLLRSQGYTVYGPMEIENPGYDYGGRDYEDFLRADIERVLTYCDSILLGPGWTRSRGARDEFAHAAATGKYIFFWDQENETMIRMDAWTGAPDGAAPQKYKHDVDSCRCAPCRDRDTGDDGHRNW